MLQPGQGPASPDVRRHLYGLSIVQGPHVDGLDAGSGVVLGVERGAAARTEEAREPVAAVGHPLDGPRLPGDCNLDANRDVSDVICLSNILFDNRFDRAYPCGGDDLQSDANKVVLDINGDGTVDISDAIAEATWLFLGGDPPAAGTECLVVTDCEPSEDTCAP